MLPHMPRSEVRLRVYGEPAQIMIHPKVGDVETLEFISSATGAKLGMVRTRHDAQGRVYEQTFVPPGTTAA